MKMLRFLLYVLCYCIFFTGYSQNSIISEYSKELKLYNFSDPNPIPILTSNNKIYPYFTFDGYEKKSSKKSGSKYI